MMDILKIVFLKGVILCCTAADVRVNSEGHNLERLRVIVIYEG